MRRLIACLQALQVTFRASAESPAVNPALVIRNWGLSPARVEIDGQPVPAGPEPVFPQASTLALALRRGSGRP